MILKKNQVVPPFSGPGLILKKNSSHAPFFGPRAGRSSKIEIKNCESHKFERHVSRPREMPVQSTFRDDPLKNKMLLRLPEKSLTDEDIQELLEQTKMTRAEIEEWTSHFQFRRKNLTEGELTAYLRRETPVNKHSIYRKNALSSK